MMKSYLRIIYTLLMVTILLACNKKKDIPTPIEFEIKGHNWDANPYKFSKQIEAVLAEKGNQMAAWEYSYIGKQHEMLRAWDGGRNSRTPLDEEKKAVLQDYKATPAIPYILKEADNYEITIINEAHQMPQHRVFTSQLLQGLYDQGYRYLGMESIFSSDKNDSLLQADKYPRLVNGYYIKEPQYGNLVRKALKIGFEIFAYESEGHSEAKEREENQATNIHKFMESNNKGKYLIHCGFAHGYEGEYGGQWDKAMAQRLKDKSGKDLFTISQEKFSENSDKSYEDPYYQELDVDEPSIVFQNNGEMLRNIRGEAYFDIAVVHPRSEVGSRPQWLSYGNRKIRKIDFSKADINCPCLVYAYVDGEEVGAAIPYDIQETDTKEADLVLEPGNYNFVLQSDSGKSFTMKKAIK